jgi:2-alkyl-3-oxoalkanoate reductase
MTGCFGPAGESSGFASGVCKTARRRIAAVVRSALCCALIPGSAVEEQTAMKCLVTGGGGFSGLHLVERLLARGDEPTVIELADGSAVRRLEQLGVRVVQGSVTDTAVVGEAARGQEVVFHLASAFRQIYAPDRLYWDVDVEGTRAVLEAARTHGVRRVVHVSTQGVHGSLLSTPGDEDSPIRPTDYYCTAKFEGERVCEEFMAGGLDVTILRPTSIYGPGDTHGWLKLFRMVEKGRFLMIGSGRTLNHPLYVTNLVDALIAAADAPAARGRTYIIADTRAVTLNELVNAVAEAMDTQVRIFRFPSYRLAHGMATVVELALRPFGGTPPIFRRRLSWFRTNRSFSIARARQELGYEPAIDLAEGLRRTARWYRDQGLLRADGRGAGEGIHTRSG